jgi:hypothetical protein
MIMGLKAKAVLSALVMGSLIIGCSPRGRYEAKLKQELANGTRSDSIFMGIYLGMTEKEFYSQCWNLNRKGLVRQGESNSTVQYQIKKELKYPATMDFYPRFVNGRIAEMPVKFAYTGWAPWNRALSAEKLEDDILRWYRKEYGRGFMSVRDRLKGTAWVKLDGNRRISLFREDDLHVMAVFTDLLAPKDTVRQSQQVSDTLTKSGENAGQN